MTALKLHYRLIQAPLAGYSCAAMRALTWLWGGIDYCCSEMISAKHLAHNRYIAARYRCINQHEGPTCIQLSGDDSTQLQVAAAQAASWGASIIDLNCGCPMPKIRKKHCGSKLLANSKHLALLIRAIKSSSKLPVTIKIRVDSHSGEAFNRDVAHAAEDSGAAAIIVHGRHWSENYETPVSYEDIASIKQNVTIPVIGNGDIADAEGAVRMLTTSGCDGIMIARACVGRPWLFAEINAALENRSFMPPQAAQIGELLVQHLAGLMQLQSETQTLLQARRLVKYYAREYYTSCLQQQVMQAANYQELCLHIQRHFAECPQRANALPPSHKLAK